MGTAPIFIAPSRLPTNAGDGGNASKTLPPAGTAIAFNMLPARFISAATSWKV
jgi:hypothetical protein